MEKYPIVTFRDYDSETIKKGLKMPEVAQVINDKVYENLLEAISKDKKTLIVCKVRKREEFLEKPKFKVIAKSNDFKNIANTLEKYYALKEDYDKCVKLRDLNL